MLLPLIGAGLGGYEAYRQSGGNIGATLLGAGLGAATPAALRMAGTALGARLGAEALGKASGAVTSQALQANLAARALGETGAQGVARNVALAGSRKLAGLGGKLGTAAGLGGLVAGAGLGLGAANLAGGIAGAMGRGAQAAQPLAGQAAQTALGYGAYRPTEVDYGAGLAAYDPNVVGQYGGISPVGSPSDILGPLGIGRTLETQRQAKAGAEAMRLLGTEQMRFTEAAKRKDFERQAAMKGIAQNIMTQAAMLQGAQQAAIGMGQTGMEGVSRGLTQLYQYQ